MSDGPVVGPQMGPVANRGPPSQPIGPIEPYPHKEEV